MRPPPHCYHRRQRPCRQPARVERTLLPASTIIAAAFPLTRTAANAWRTLPEHRHIRYDTPPARNGTPGHLNTRDTATARSSVQRAKRTHPAARTMCYVCRANEHPHPAGALRARRARRPLLPRRARSAAPPGAARPPRSSACPRYARAVPVPCAVARCGRIRQQIQPPPATAQRRRRRSIGAGGRGPGPGPGAGGRAGAGRGVRCDDRGRCRGAPHWHGGAGPAPPARRHTSTRPRLPLRTRHLWRQGAHLLVTRSRDLLMVHGSPLVAGRRYAYVLRVQAAPMNPLLVYHRLPFQNGHDVSSPRGARGARERPTGSLRSVVVAAWVTLAPGPRAGHHVVQRPRCPPV